MKDKSLIYLLGGGVSVKELGIDIPRCRKEGYVLGINRAVIHVQCDGVFAVDKQFEIKDSAIWRTYDKEAHTCYSHPRDKVPQSWRTDWKRIDKADPTKQPECLETGLVGCVNSGNTAILLALKMGAKCIILLGYDLPMVTEAWYDLELDVPNVRFKYEGIMRNFEHCTKIYKDLWPDVKILNSNKESNIKCYDFVEPSEIYDRHSLLTR